MEIKAASDREASGGEIMQKGTTEGLAKMRGTRAGNLPPSQDLPLP
jgi:hypothetical protein